MSAPTRSISVVVVAYEMARELPRTLFTLGPSFQVGAVDAEIVVIDNGSPTPVSAAVLGELPSARLHRIPPERAHPSPASACNEGLALASHDLIGLMIDGARMVSPGMLELAARAASLSPRAVVATTAYHLGHEVQMKASATGYDQRVEDELLASVPWRDNGYELFTISTLAGSSHRGWFGPMGESNALFMHRELWAELGGLDEEFDRPGGGLANHDLYRRACELPDTQHVLLLGEGTFHQYHHGAATGQGDTHDELWAEYERIRGRPFRPPDTEPTLIGTVPTEAIAHLRRSLSWIEKGS